MIKWLTATDLVFYKPLISEKNHKKTKQAQSSDGKFLLLTCTFFNEIVSMLNFWLIMNLVRLEKYKTILWQKIPQAKFQMIQCRQARIPSSKPLLPKDRPPRPPPKNVSVLLQIVLHAVFALD